MSNIIKANFAEMDKGTFTAAGLSVKELMRYEQNGLKVILTEPNEGKYAVNVFQTVGEMKAVFRKTSNKGLAIVVYNEIAEHIENSNRTFEELVAMLVNRLKI